MGLFNFCSHCNASLKALQRFRKNHIISRKFFMRLPCSKEPKKRRILSFERGLMRKRYTHSSQETGNLDRAKIPVVV
jgi:hypothetical protein